MESLGDMIDAIDSPRTKHDFDGLCLQWQSLSTTRYGRGQHMRLCSSKAQTPILRSMEIDSNMLFQFIIAPRVLRCFETRQVDCNKQANECL